MINELNNIRIVHEGAIQPDPTYAKRPLEWYLGRHVKLAFQGACGTVEHMWVEVTGFDDAHVIGSLDNVPQFATHLSLGDSVTLSRIQIEAVDLTEGEWWDEVSVLRAKGDFFNPYLGSPTRDSGFGEFYHEHFTPRQALDRWVKWQPDEDDPLTFLTDIVELRGYVNM